MAIFHFDAGKRVGRGAGKSVMAVAAYQARERYRDERTGEVYNYRSAANDDRVDGIRDAWEHDAREGRHSDRKPPLYVTLYKTGKVQEWCRGAEHIEEYWNRAEAAEKHPNAQIAERYIGALPHELIFKNGDLTLERAVRAVQDFVHDTFDREGRVTQISIHAPDNDPRNGHVHLLSSLRGVNENGFNSSKWREQQERYLHRSEYITGLRETWARTMNRHLERAEREDGLEQGAYGRIDHRSLKERGIDREPNIHLGPAAAEIDRAHKRGERLDERSVLGDRQREIQARNAEQEQAKREIAEVEAEIVDLDAWRLALEQEAEPTAQSAAQTPEAAPEPELPPAANSAPDALQSGCQEHDQPEAEIIDFDAWHRELEQEAAAARPEQAAEQPSPPLYERYQAERERIWQARQAAFEAHRERFDRYADAIRQWDRGVHTVIYDFPWQERRVERLLQSNRRAEAWIEFREAERAQRQEIKDRHSLPSWTEWLEKEAARGAKDAQQAIDRRDHKARAVQKALLQTLDDVELWQEVRKDTGPLGWPLTIEEVARDLAPVYRWAGDDLAALKEQEKDADLEQRHEQRKLDAAEEAIEKRRSEMGWWRRMLGGDPELVGYEADAKKAGEELARLDAESQRRAEQIVAAEKAMADAFAAIKDRAERELQDRQQTAALAREVEAEREAARAARRQQDRGLDHERDEDELER